MAGWAAPHPCSSWGFCCCPSSRHPASLCTTVLFGFSYFLDPSCALRKGMGIIILGGITVVVAVGCAGACAKGTCTSLCSRCPSKGSRSFLGCFFFLQSGCLQEEMKA